LPEPLAQEKPYAWNTCILSLLFRGSPNELKFLMIIRKMVELCLFNGLAHLLCPVLLMPRRRPVALNWVVGQNGGTLSAFS